MQVPAWLAQAEAQRIALLKKAEREAGKPVVKIRTTLREAGWVDLGMEFTCVPDPVNPWDPNVVKAIWTFDPGFVPVWVRWKFARYDNESPEVKVFGRHVIARHEENLTVQPVQFPCQMPTMPCQGITFKKPNILEKILMEDDSKDDSPGSFVPWTWDIFNWARRRYNASVKDKQQIIRDQQDAAAAQLEKFREEQAYIHKDVMRFVTNKLENVSEVDIKNYLLAKKENKVRTYVGLAGPTPQQPLITL